ncbi:MAG: hypothetical protein RLZZ316_759 [Bacteroidota bacterium]|jgi:hypothetical protein
MKQILHLFNRNFIALLTLVSFTFLSCQKESISLQDPIVNGGDNTVNKKGTITLVNNTPTAVWVYVDGVAANKALGAKSTLVLSGDAGQQVAVEMYAYATDKSGNAIGETVQMANDYIFPAINENETHSIDIPGYYFFLTATNNTDAPVDQLVVNNAYPEEVTDDVVIDNNGKITTCGYQVVPTALFTNIKAVRNKDPYQEYDFTDIKLSSELNQKIRIDIY